MNIKKRLLSTLLTSSLLLFSGCSVGKFSGDRPYDSKFATAEDFADYWCGPCEEVSSNVITTGSSEVTIHRIKDTELDFIYTVEERSEQSSNRKKTYISYTCHDFDYYYLRAFLNRTDFSSITDKYDITFGIDDLIPTINEGIYYPYVARIVINTDSLLTDNDGNEIIRFFYNALDEFDNRNHFTKDPNCTSTWIELFSAPNEEEISSGIPHHSYKVIYGYSNK